MLKFTPITTQESSSKKSVAFRLPSNSSCARAIQLYTFLKRKLESVEAMESINAAPDDLESQPLLGREPKLNTHKPVYRKRKLSKIDLIALLVYLIHLVGMITLSVFVFRRKDRGNSNSVELEFEWFIFYAGLTTVVAFLLSPFVLLLSFVNPVVLISWNSLLLIGGSIAMIGTAFKFLTLPLAISTCALGAFGIVIGSLMVYHPWRLRKTVGSNLKASASIVLHRPVSWLVNFFTVVLNAVILGYGLYLIHEILLRYPLGLGIFFTFLTAISMLWNSLVVSYIGYVTCAGSFASWYFSFNPNVKKRYPYGTLKALFRSLSVSLGSIAVGSLLLTVLFIMRIILLLCGQRPPKQLTNRVNEYTMIFMALNGNSFMRASKEARNIVEANVEPADLTRYLLLTYALGFGATCTFGTLLLSGLYYHEPYFYGIDRYVYFFLLSLAIMACTTWLAWTSVAPQTASINTIFICYTIDLAPFPRTPATVYNSLKEAFFEFSKEVAKIPARTKPTRNPSKELSIVEDMHP